MVKTQLFIDMLEAGCVPWIPTEGTTAAKTPLIMPTNAATGRPYSGINVLVLWGVVVAQDFPGQSCLTFAKPSRSRIVQLMLLN